MFLIGVWVVFNISVGLWCPQNWLEFFYKTKVKYFEHVGLGRTQIGDFAGTYAAQSIASLEFYLRALSQTEMIEAMQRSIITLPTTIQTCVSG